MAFGNSIMDRFSDDAIELDAAYEGLYDTTVTNFDEFMSIACEGDACYECDEDDIYDDEDEDIEFDDDEDYDDEDEYDEEDEECVKENAITDATPQQKRERYFKMIDANPRFSPEKKKEMKENYDKSHPEGLSATKESAADYLRAKHMIDNRTDESLTNDVDDAYDASDYDDDYLSNHAKYSSNLKTGYVRLRENMDGINNFVGDRTAAYASNLKTSYAREGSIDQYYEDYAAAQESYDNVMKNMNGGHYYNENTLSEYDKMALEGISGVDGIDVDDGLDNCRSALESMIDELDSLT